MKKNNLLLENYKRIFKEDLMTEAKSPLFNRLINQLEACADAAIDVFNEAEDQPEKYEGNENAELRVKLKNIWNAFSTGDPENDENEDAIFK